MPPASLQPEALPAAAAGKSPWLARLLALLRWPPAARRDARPARAPDPAVMPDDLPPPWYLT